MIRVHSFVRFVVAFAASAFLPLCDFGKDAAAGIVILSSEASHASYEVHGYGTHPASEIDLNSGLISGSTSAAVGTDFDSGDGFRGHTEASTRFTASAGYNHLLVTSSIASSLIFDNLSNGDPDDFESAFSEVHTIADSMLVFHTGEAGLATLTWNLNNSFATLGAFSNNGLDPFERRTTTLLQIVRNDFTDFSFILAQTSTNDAAGAPVFESSNGTYRGGNSISLDLTPGDYTIEAFTESYTQAFGPGRFADPLSNRGEGTVQITTEAVPEPASVGIWTVLGLAGMIAARRRTQDKRSQEP